LNLLSDDLLPIPLDQKAVKIPAGNYLIRERRHRLPGGRQSKFTEARVRVPAPARGRRKIARRGDIAGGPGMSRVVRHAPAEKDGGHQKADQKQEACGYRREHILLHPICLGEPNR
jgi:hypothetical protein